jgi:hypothetical protein
VEGAGDFSSQARGGEAGLHWLKCCLASRMHIVDDGCTARLQTPAEFRSV